MGSSVALSPAVAVSLLALAALGCAESGAAAAPTDMAAVADATGEDTAPGAPADTVDAPRDAPAAADTGSADTVDSDASPRQSALDEAIVAAMTADHIPGVAVALIRGDQVLHLAGYGLADVEEELPVTSDTAFMLASVSKTVVAMAAVLAVDDGALDLDADINSVLPFAVHVPAHPEVAITTRMLLTHTAGLADPWERLSDLYVDGDSEIPLATVLEQLLTATGAYYDADTNFTGAAPGTAYEYSNIGAALAAFVVESATGVPFDELCKQRIFTPLGMTHTGWHLADLAGVPLAVPYAYTDGSYETYGHYGYPDYPDGALRSSITDLAALLRMVIGGGVLNGTSVLPGWGVAEMLSDLIPTIEPGQGLAWYSYDDGDVVYWGHEGGDAGVSTTCFFRPSDGVGVIVLANLDAPEGADDWALYTIESLLYDAAVDWP